MATIDVKDASGSTVAIEKPLAPGRTAAAGSRPVVLSTEDKAAVDALATGAKQDAANTLLGSITETAPVSDTASSGLNGRLQRIAQRVTSMMALLPAALSSGGSLKVSLEETNASQIVVGFGSAAADGFTNTVTTIQGAGSATARLLATAGWMFNGATWDRVRGDVTNGVDVDVTRIPALVAGTAVIGKVDHSSTGIGHGVTTVTTAGTDVVLAGSTAAKWVTIQAQTDNTGLVAVGATGVDATIATGNGIALAAGESITLPIDNLADVFVDSLVNGDGVRYVYGT